MNNLEKELIKLLYLSNVFTNLKDEVYTLRLNCYVFDYTSYVDYRYNINPNTNLIISSKDFYFHYEYMYLNSDCLKYPDDLKLIISNDIYILYKSTDDYKLFEIESPNIIKQIVINHFKNITLKELKEKNNIFNIKLYSNDLLNLII